jgi:fermentation-respiration switch protein FrsA (DUF1100 family)
VPVFVPEQPARPAIAPRPASPESTVVDYQFGWNAKARSVAPLVGNGAFQFRVPRDTSGAVVGLAVAPRNDGYRDINFGFYVANGVVRILELGVEVANLGAHPNALLRVTRSGGRILYDIDGTLVRERANSDAPVYLTAGLYIGGDTVEDAELVDTATVSLTFEPLLVYAGEDEAEQIIFSFEPLEIEAISYPTGSIDLVFEPLEVVAADAGGYSFAGLDFLPLTVGAEQDALVPEYAFAEIDFMPMTFAAAGVTHIIGNIEFSMEPLLVLASDDAAYTQAILSFEPLEIYADEGERPDQAIIFSGADHSLSIQPVTILFAVVDGSMNIVGMFTVSGINTAQMLSAFNVTDTYELAQVLQASIESWMDASVLTFDSATGKDVWVYHMDVDGSTRYEGYDFTDIKKVGDAYYGVKPDGIYLLEGLDDDGEAAQARINFGSLNFGAMDRKALPYVYIGMASNGDTYLKVTTTEIDRNNRPANNLYTYRVRDNTEIMKAHRFELGRGLRSSFYELELVSEGAVFDLHSIEFQPVKLSRRL